LLHSIINGIQFGPMPISIQKYMLRTKTVVKTLLKVIINAILLVEWIDFSTFAANLKINYVISF